MAIIFLPVMDGLYRAWRTLSSLAEALPEPIVLRVRERCFRRDGGVRRFSGGVRLDMSCPYRFVRNSGT
jgi:hypothetical protein